MVSFTFICKEDSGNWSANRYKPEDAEDDFVDLDAEADSTWDLQVQLRKLAIDNSPGGGLSANFSMITPSSAIYQVIVGGAVMMGGGGGGGAAPAAGGAAAGGGGEAAAEAKKEESEEEEESDEDMGFSLFD
eukprot:TRINITY_DN36212_c0_g1_i2.p2 TRINITY_DN36212_c0_g1~~TRINITY_DN36212_c0_g1_i2.p2  ORF type:complete len:132 (+),score=57.53 TRINITY_DN36212_c0_g1_i2:91-486(+)